MKNFFSNSENKIVNKFNKNGYIIFDIKKKKQLDNIRKKILILSRKNLKKKITKIESIHNYLPKNELNKFRMKIYSELNKSKNFLSNYYSLGDDFLDVIC